MFVVLITAICSPSSVRVFIARKPMHSMQPAEVPTLIWCAGLRRRCGRVYTPDTWPSARTFSGKVTARSPAPKTVATAGCGTFGAYEAKSPTKMSLTV